MYLETNSGKKLRLKLKMKKNGIEAKTRYISLVINFLYCLDCLPRVFVFALVLLWFVVTSHPPAQGAMPSVKGAHVS